MAQLKRQLNSIQLWSIAVGMVISGQYFGWNYGFASGLWGLVIAAGIVTVFYICFMLTYAQLAVSIPQAGGPMAYAQKALGPWFGYVVGLACLIEFLFAAPAIAVATGSYVHFLAPALQARIVTWTVYTLFIVVNLGQVKNAALIEMVATILALLGLLGFYYLGLTAPAVAYTSVQAPIHSWHAVMSAVPFAIWLYLAIEGGALSAEEVKTPGKTIPRGLIAAIMTLAICSLLTILTTAHLLQGPHVLVDYPIPAALQKIHATDSVPVMLVSCLGLFGLLASLNGIIMGCSRQMFGLARAGYLPAALQKLTRKDVPYVSVLVTGLIGMICVSSANISAALIEVAVFGALVMYLGALISWFVLNRRGSLNNEYYKVPFSFIPKVALIACLVCLYAVCRYAIWTGTLDIMGWHFSLFGLVIFISVVAFIYYIFRIRKS